MSQIVSPSQSHQLVLEKKSGRWVLRYAPGQEAAMLRWLADTAKNPESGLDWFDAAVLSQQMGDQIARQLKTMMND